MKGYNVPTLVLGGGGYTIRNVARCWAYETAVLLGEDIDNQIPFNDYYEYYAPEFELHLKPDESMDDANHSLDEIRSGLLQQLKDLQGAPSVQMQQVPPAFREAPEEDGEESSGKKKHHSAEFYDRVD